MPNSLSNFESVIGYRFLKKSYLNAALTHTSIRNKGKEFERLEFLGDRILGLVIAEMVFKQYPSEREGDLAKRFAGLVCREMCEHVAKDINLASIIKISSVDDLKNSAILADAVEALIGAIYLDGGLESAQGFIEKFWQHLLKQNLTPPKDAKSTLQEWSQSKGLPIPFYKEVSRSGPDHAPVFNVVVCVKGFKEIHGTGNSKRIAEQQAAQSFLETSI